MLWYPGGIGHSRFVTWGRGASDGLALVWLNFCCSKLFDTRGMDFERGPDGGGHERFDASYLDTKTLKIDAFEQAHHH